MVAKRGAYQQRAVARELGTTDATVSRLERGLNTPTPALAGAIARWLGWSMEEVYRAAAESVVQEEPQPPLGSTALQIPDGRLLAPWSELSPGTWVRAGGPPYSILVDAQGAKLRLKGLDYTEAEPNRTIEERQALLDAWLLAQGATRSLPLATQ